MNAQTKAFRIAAEIGKPENAIMIERQLLIKEHEANQRAIALASVSETTIRHLEAMTVGQRRHQHEVATMEAIRHDILAGRKCNAEFADHHRGLAENNRRVAAALKAIGL